MSSDDYVENVIETLKGFCINNNSTNVKVDGNADDGKVAVSGEDDNIQTAEKLRAFKLLPTVASTLKVDDVRSKLIPVIELIITAAVDNGDDEALMVLGEKLGEFVPLVGGGSFASCLLPLLARIICCVEEVVVVQAACDSLNKIIPTLDANVIDTNCIQLVRNIFADDLYCASRKAGVRLIPVLYQRANSESQTELKNRLLHLCMTEEEIPLVRAAAIEQLVELSQAAGPNFKADLIKTLTTLINDNQRVVRASIVKPTLELSRNVDANEFDTIIMPLLDKMSEDTNRETRRGLALQISEFQKISQKFDKTLNQLLIKLMEDNEIDARKIVAGQLKEFCSICPQNVLTESVLPKIREHLTLEREDRVKAELVKSVVMMIPDFKREDSLPLVQHVLSFLNETNPQTKQYVFEHFRGLVGLISPGELQLTIIPSLFKLFGDKNWRIRSGVVSSIKLIVPIVDEQCCRETLMPSISLWLRDPVWDIRRQACDIVGTLVSLHHSLLSPSLAIVSGSSTNNSAAAITTNSTTNTTNTTATTPNSNTTPINTTSNSSSSTASQSTNPLFTALQELSKDHNYHQRQCWCNLIQSICLFVKDSSVVRQFLMAPINNDKSVIGTLINLIESDPVPNVKLTAIRSLEQTGPHLESSSKTQLESVLKKHATSSQDSDVKYFSEMALSYIEASSK